MKVAVHEDKLIVEIELEKNPQVSKSGKNIVIASTHGIAVCVEQYKGKPIKIGLNAFVRV